MSDMSIAMISSRPYLVRSLNEWILDNDCTSYIVVDAGVQGIVLVATPTIARQFKPLFAFYYGGDLPVYAPSIIYGGEPDPGKDRDINNVNFTDIPWVLAEDNQLREQAQQYLSGTRGQLGRLFAMGADAWQLSKRLP